MPNKSLTNPTESNDLLDKDAVLVIREEKLDITKKAINLEEVVIYEEVITEKKGYYSCNPFGTSNRKKVTASNDVKQIDEDTETFRIPIYEEQLEIVKHPVLLQKVTVHRHQVQETLQVTKELKKEKIHIDTL